MTGPDGSESPPPNQAPALTLVASPEMASPGFGKYSAPDQAPLTDTTFAGLPKREAALARLIDGLAEGTLMSVKALAALQDEYGQAAVRTALRYLEDVGHLHRKRLRAPGRRVTWVQFTGFSRTPRDKMWWRIVRASREAAMKVEYESGTAAKRDAATVPGPRREPQAAPVAEAAPVVPPMRRHEPVVSSERSRIKGYNTLSVVAGLEPRMRLSDKECRVLAPLAGQWIDRGADPMEVRRALTTDLPARVRNPGALARTRLRANMPAARGAPVRQWADPGGAATAYNRARDRDAPPPGPPGGFDFGTMLKHVNDV